MKKKLFHKITALTLTRRIIQVLSFVLFPGLFISTFSAIKSIYVALIGGTFSASALAGQIILAVAMLLITAIMGRFFCGFLCAFGTMGDFFWYLGTKLKLPRPKIGSKVDRILKKLKYVILVLIVLLIWTFGATILNGTNNPWTVFGMYASVKGWADLSALVSVGALLLLLIIVGSMFIERMFCRYLCPLGGIFAIVSKFRLFKIRKPRAKCGACRACTKRCSMGISLYRTSVVKSAECIDCMNCVEICPRDNVSANPKPAFAAAVAVVALSGMYYVGNIAGNAAAEYQAVAAAESVSSENTASAGPFVDGSYTGSAAGYHGQTSVQVTVQNGYLTDISILSTGDDMEFFNQAKSGVIAGILSAQSVNVDTVTGATFSSRGIIDAVSNAISGALKTSGDVSIFAADTSNLTPTPVLTPTPSPVPTPTPTATPEATPEATQAVADGPIALPDGSYSGTGSGFRGDTDVTVTVENGKITKISIDSYRDDNEYFSRAKKTMISRILDAQSVDVDTVSGATYSSSGILDAVADALGLDYTGISSSGHRH
jgi:uncharacterized protein with FMN-binding domain/NAD-dependent dihydropyrimidine dehydrogenase PreA subunit